MRDSVKLPTVVEELSWVHRYWPSSPETDGENQDVQQNSSDEIRRPDVAKYFLHGMKDSFTDFHIDFW